MRRYLFALPANAALLFCHVATAQAPDPANSLGPTVNPPVAGDPVTHHHKAYPKTKYGISCSGDRVVWVNTNSGVYHLEGER